jgi:hypothetical protein
MKWRGSVPRFEQRSRNTTDKEMQMVKRTIRRLVIAPLMLLAVMLGYSQRVVADQRTGPFYEQDRPGMDYRSFASWHVAQCRSACAMEGQCRSWTYKYIDPYDSSVPGVCQLKTGVPRSHFDRLSVSGVKPPPPAVKAGRDRPPPDVEGMPKRDPLPPVVKR